MQSIDRMIATHPSAQPVEPRVLRGAIDALVECAEVCTACADACLAEPDNAALRRCITLDLACADVCGATARTLARHSGAEPALWRRLLEVCVEACRLCGAECARHADMHAHCAVCRDACRRCEEACDELLDHLGG